jgi:hypothetical protein
MPASRCTICSSPNLAAIDSLLDGGQFKKDIAAQFSVSVHALSRHGRGLCRADALDTEEEKWAARLEKTYQQAVTDGDVRGQQQTATVALRHVRQRKLERTKAAEAAPDSEDDGKFDISQFDSFLEAISRDDSDGARLRLALEKAHAMRQPDFIEILSMCYERPGFGDALREFARQWREEHRAHEPVQAEAAAHPN